MARSSNKLSAVRLSRREFARAAVLAAATVAVPRSTPAHNSSVSSDCSQEPSAQAAQLSPAGEAQVQTILAKYGKRLSDEQQTEVRRLIGQAQKTTDKLRSYALENSDEPAMIFHIYRGS